MALNKTQLFRISKDKVDRVEIQNDFSEKKVQNFYEKNLDELLDTEFIETEYAFEGGRIDTFGIDKDFRPVIIEYKKSTSDSVLLQALFYKNYIGQNWEKAYKTIIDKKGKEFADKIDWFNIRLILVAQEFDKWTIASTTFLSGVELYKFTFFGDDTFTHEFLNLSKKKSNKKYKNIDYSTVEKIGSEKNHVNAITNLYKYNSMSNKLQRIYEDIIEYIDDNIPQSEIVYKKQYWFVKSQRKFMDFIFRKNKIIILLPKGIKVTNGLKFEDIAEKGSWGTLDLRFNIETHEDKEKILELISQAYNLTNV